MDKWLIGLLLCVLALPLIFAGNFNSALEAHGEKEGAREAARVEAPRLTAEIRLGYAFATANLGNEEGFRPGEAVAYTPPGSYQDILPGTVYVGGVWGNAEDSLELLSEEGKLVVKYSSASVSIEAGPGTGQSLIQAVINGMLVNSSNQGSDISSSGIAVVDSRRLFNLVSQEEPHLQTVEINVRGKGLKVYAIVFG